MDMEFAPDGGLFVAEQAGRLRIVKPDGTLATFLDISTKVDSSGERGCWRSRLTQASPPTATSTSTTPGRLRPPPRPHNRVVRVTASGDKVVAGSEKLIFRLGNQSATNNGHMGGALDFGKDGKLYIATGETKTPRTRSSSPTSSARCCA